MKYYPILKHTTRYKKSMCKVKINVNRDIRVFKYIYSLLLSYTIYIQYYFNIHYTHLSIEEASE